MNIFPNEILEIIFSKLNVLELIKIYDSYPEIIKWQQISKSENLTKKKKCFEIYKYIPNLHCLQIF